MALSTDFVDNYGNTFRNAYQAAYQQVTEREEQKILAGQRKDYHFLAANLASFLPHIPASDYERIYRRILTNHSLSGHNFRYVDFGSLNHLSIEGDTRFLDPHAKRTARIFCTYHLGGYRAVLALLLNAGYPLALVIDNRIYRQQKEYIEGIVSQLNDYNKTSLTIQILDAESMDIGKRMAMALATGHSILVFPDGNTGVGGVYHRGSRQLKVRFLNQTIYSRTGIATLSHALKTPITPIISHYIEANGIQLPYFHCAETIDPRQLGMSQEEYVRYATTTLYGILSDELEKYVDQWESWFYIHKFLDTDELAAQAPPPPNAPADLSGEFVFDNDRFGLFKLEQDGYLFDKLTYRSYTVSESVYGWLSAFAVIPPDSDSYAELLSQQPIDVVEQFYRQRVLVQSTPATPDCIRGYQRQSTPSGLVEEVTL